MAAKDSAVEPNVINLKDYRVPPYLVDDVHLNFLLHDDHARVVSKTVYKANPQSDDVSVLVLNGKALELCEIAIDGVVLGEDAYQIVGEELHLSVPV